MNLKSPWFWVVAVAVILVLTTIGQYNRFVTLSRFADAQWAQVEVQLQRRFDLIPNLVRSVEGIFKQEQTVFGALALARTRYAGAVTVDDKVKAAREVESALGRLLVIVENYPQLRSSESVTRLMDELAGTENRVAVERGRFNQTVRDYNISVSRFPGRVFAAIFSFAERELFEARPEAREAPKVQF